ncbi:MAG: CapA family protein [Flavobacteriaceae bacterium]|jgi:poly-gamma-glutamate capsule biosynthesis protein CapA/YwtB (metallophosphatase superfamily)|nr:CapA family protein [Flavobacteriaceae bacterium]
MVSCKGRTESPIIPKPEVVTSSTVPDTLVITAVGDIMLGSNYPLSSGLPEGNILEKVTPILKEDSHILLGNLEGTLFDTGGLPKQCNNPGLCFVFRTPSSYGEYLQKAGFDFLSIANNHSGDFGSFGREATQKNLDDLGISYAGILEYCEYSIKEKDGVKYAFIGAGHNSGLVSVKEYSDIQRIIKEVRAKADIVIVMFHGGAEGAAYQHVPYKREIYAEEDRGDVLEFSHVCIDAGADIVFGSGPHVTRAVELYKNKFIAYSLGNFATYGNFRLKGANGKAPILKIKLDSDGNFISGTVISTYQIEDTGMGPEIDTENQALHYMQTLTSEDFPDGKLEILDNGEIKKR